MKLFVLDRHTLPGHKLGVDVIEMSQDGTRCVSWDSTAKDTTLYLWDIVQGLCLVPEPTKCTQLSAVKSKMLCQSMHASW